MCPSSRCSRPVAGSASLVPAFIRCPRSRFPVQPFSSPASRRRQEPGRKGVMGGPFGPDGPGGTDRAIATRGRSAPEMDVLPTRGGRDERMVVGADWPGRLVGAGGSGGAVAGPVLQALFTSPGSPRRAGGARARGAPIAAPAPSSRYETPHARARPTATAMLSTSAQPRGESAVNLR